MTWPGVHHGGPAPEAQHQQVLIQAQFHQLNRSPGESLQAYIDKPVTMQEAGPLCWPEYDFGPGCNYTVILEGWFGDLADLRQENPSTRAYLLEWIRNLQSTYGIDGFRLDTVTYMPKDLDPSPKPHHGAMLARSLTQILTQRTFWPNFNGWPGSTSWGRW